MGMLPHTGFLSRSRLKKSYAVRTAYASYRRIRKAAAEWRGESFLCEVDRASLKEVIARNRQALAEIGDWLPAGLLDGAVFRYGVTPATEPLLNLPVDNECTAADLLAYLGKTLPGPLKYLELGVSVGKTFWQVLNTCSPSECWAFDIEEINPVLKERFVEQGRTEWPSPPNSIKKTMSSATHFFHPPSGSKITYICADIFDERAWKLLAGGGFNVVFSDAMHTPQALDFEWQQMKKMNIFSPKTLAIIWDDLDWELKDWFCAKRSIIAADLGAHHEDISMLFLNGWLGRREYPHQLGLALKSDAVRLGVEPI